MMPRLGEKYHIALEVISKSRAEYQAESYRQAGLPAAPAIMVGEELVTQGANVTEDQVEAAIRRQLDKLSEGSATC